MGSVLKPCLKKINKHKKTRSQGSKEEEEEKGGKKKEGEGEGEEIGERREINKWLSSRTWQ